MPTKPAPLKSSTPSAAVIIGSILALGVIRLLERQEELDKLTEERVHTGVLTTQENTLE